MNILTTASFALFGEVQNIVYITFLLSTKIHVSTHVGHFCMSVSFVLKVLVYMCIIRKHNGMSALKDFN